MLARNHFMTAIAEEARTAHARFTGGIERFDVTYEPNVAFEAPPTRCGRADARLLRLPIRSARAGRRSPDRIATI